MDANNWWTGLDLKKAVRERPSQFSTPQLLRIMAGLLKPHWEPGAELDPALEPVRFTGAMGQRFPAGDISRASVPADRLDGEASDAQAREAQARDAQARDAQDSVSAGPARIEEPAVVELASFSFGGPQGPLPRLLTDELHRRARAGDTGALAFLDMFIHRLANVDYQSERAFRPDMETRPPTATAADAVPRAIAGLPSSPNADAAGVADRLILRYAPLFARRPLSSESLRRILADHLGATVTVREAVGRWLEIPAEARSRLTPRRHNNALGDDLVLGSRSWRQTAGMTFTMGALAYPTFRETLPGGREHQRLRALLRFGLNAPVRIDARLILQGAQVPELRVRSENGPRLGWTTWLGHGGGADREISVTLLDSRECI